MKLKYLTGLIFCAGLSFLNCKPEKPTEKEPEKQDYGIFIEGVPGSGVEIVEPEIIGSHVIIEYDTDNDGWGDVRYAFKIVKFNPETYDVLVAPNPRRIDFDRNKDHKYKTIDDAIETYYIKQNIPTFYMSDVEFLLMDPDEQMEHLQRYNIPAELYVDARYKD